MLYILTLFFFNLSARAILMLLLESPSPAFSSTLSLWIMRSSQLPPPPSHLQVPQKQIGSRYLCVFPCCSFSTLDNKYRHEVVVTPADERRQREERQRNNQQDERPGRDLTRVAQVVSRHGRWLLDIEGRQLLDGNVTTPDGRYKVL
jgi:hypothetical protein